jgi:Na+-transporting NADH:ubiquinone oxidoreductase subunit C
MKNDAIKTVFVATILCVVCSVLVSGAAVLLKPDQDKNKALDVKKNLLLASGLIHEPVTPKDIETAYSQIQAEVIDLSTGDVAKAIDPKTFDQAKASKDPEMGIVIAADKDISGIKYRSKYALVYKYIKDGAVQMVVLPVHGKGLWSTMYGFIALSADAQTIQGLGFYSHGETPGLGGEIDNPKWKALWIGKKVFDPEFHVKVKVIKGSVNSSMPDAEYKVDGLSGATITSNGVTHMIQYWLGPDGFGPFLKKMMEETVDESVENTDSNEEGA